MRLIPISLAAVLGGALFVQWVQSPVRPPQVAPRPAPAGDASSDAPPAPFAIPLAAREEFDVIDSRPLFIEGRRPLEPEKTSAPVIDQGELSDLDYSAVAITPKGRMAWVRDRTTGATERLGVGSAIRGWTVKSIESEFLLVENNGREARIALLEFPSAAAAATSAPPAPPAPARPVPPQRLPPRGPQR